MKRASRWIAVLATGALLLAACGSDDDDEPTDDIGGDDIEVTEPGTDDGEDDDGDGDATDLSGETLEVAAVWSGDEQDNFEQVLGQFEEDTGAEIKFTSTGDDIATILGGQIEGGSPPDVAVLPQPGLLNDLVEDDSLESIEEAVGDTMDENFDDIWRELGTVDDELYGLWFKASNKSTFWYDVDALDAAGVEPPETWDDLLDGAQVVLDSGVTPISVGGADGWTLTDWFENVYLRTAGEDMYDQLAEHEIPWTDDSVVEALDTLAELIGEDDFVVNGLDGALQIDFPTSVTNVFGSGDGAMVYEADFAAGNITGETDAELGVDADFFPFPSIDGSEPSVVGGGDVVVMLKDNDGAAALVDYLASPEAAEIWAAEGGFTSPNSNVDLDVYPDDTTRKSAEALVEAEVFRFDLSDLQPASFGSTPGQGLFKLFQDWLADPSESERIAEQMESEADDAW